MNNKKICFLKGIGFVVFLFLFSLTISASLINVYKSGNIKLVPDPDFGKGTEWDLYFPQGIMDMVFAQDGSFFATGFGNKAQHCVYKFDKNGKFIKKIGRKGRGPGDLYHPGALSILDNKYLIVCEYATSGRISVFDLNGNFVKIIRIKGNVFDVVGLENGKFVWLNKKFGMHYSFEVILSDMTGKTLKVINKFSEKRRNFSVSPSKYYGEVFIRRNKSGELIVGFNKANDVFVYDHEGDLIKKFKLSIKRREINKKDKESFYKVMEEQAERYPMYKRVIERMYEMNIFPDFTPYYENVKIDSNNNLLCFTFNDYSKKRNFNVNVYSNKGDYLSSFKINTEYDIESHNFIKQIFFYNGYIYYPLIKNDGFKLSRFKVR